MKFRSTFTIALLMLALLGSLVRLASQAGSFLVIDAPEPSDLILVLAGETERRPARAFELLQQGYGRRMVLDVPTNAKIYEFTQIELAEKYLRDLPHANANVCPIDGLSTKDESKDAARCIAGDAAGSVLIVTSDFHTRRSLSIFRREVPNHHYSVAASRNSQQFGARWWQHRQWAKTFLDEWLRLVWWKSWDEWR